MKLQTVKLEIESLKSLNEKVPFEGISLDGIQVSKREDLFELIAGHESEMRVVVGSPYIHHIVDIEGVRITYLS